MQKLNLREVFQNETFRQHIAIQLRLYSIAVRDEMGLDYFPQCYVLRCAMDYPATIFESTQFPSSYGVGLWNVWVGDLKEEDAGNLKNAFDIYEWNYQRGWGAKKWG